MKKAIIWDNILNNFPVVEIITDTSFNQRGTTMTQPPIPEGETLTALEKFAIDFCENNKYRSDLHLVEYIIAGAEWQKQKLITLINIAIREYRTEEELCILSKKGIENNNIRIELLKKIKNLLSKPPTPQ